MIRIRNLATLVVAAVPLLVQAQTANSPGGSASTGTPIDQTKSSPQKTTPGTTATSPTATNPSGTLTQGSTQDSDEKKKRGSTNGTKNTATGDVPTYPAPTKDGTPTK